MGFQLRVVSARAVFASGLVGLLTVGALPLGAQVAQPVVGVQPAPIAAQLLGGAGNPVRLQLDVRVGIVANISLSFKGDVLQIDFNNATRYEVNAVARALHRAGADVRSARAVFLNAKEAYVRVELARPLDLLDQTLVAAPGGRSRWEVVLNEPAKPDASAKPVEFKDLQFVAKDDLLEVRLVGSQELTAEVSILDAPSRVAIDLPGVSVDSLERYVANFRPGPAALVKRVSSISEAGVPRLILDLFEDVDLVDSDGVVRDGQGRIRISLARDTAALASAGALRGIDARMGAAQIDFKLQGVDPATVRSYTLEDPPRLVMDVLGLPPAQAQAAADLFKAPHPGLLAARVESTRMGSARLVFDLASSVSMVSRYAIRPGTGPLDSYTVALNVPANPNDAGYSIAAKQPAVPVSVSQRGPRVDAGAPLLVIRPVTLGPLQGTVNEPALGGSGLMGLFGRSLTQDPRYLGVRKDFEIAAEAKPQARAGLLPTVGLDYQRSSINQNVTRASNAAFPTGNSRYPNKNLSLTITQPLLKLPSIVRLDQAERSIEQARFNVMAGEQDLILRLATTYLNVAAANDGVELAEAERAATEKQLELARARLANGLGNVTQVHDAEARFSLARAKALESLNRRDDAKQGLKEIVGDDATVVRGFKGDFAASGPVPAQIEPWVLAAAEQNLGLLARKLSTEIAELEIRRQKAGYAPTVNLVASASRVDTGGSIYGSGQAYQNNEVGIRLSMPLFEGGSTNSLVREATARLGKAQSEYDMELRRAERQARAAFSSVQASLDMQTALRQAVVAQQSALEAREEGLRSGVSTPVAVIDAYRLFYAAKRDYLQARYDYLVNRLKLKQAVGILSRNDLEDLNALIEQ